MPSSERGWGGAVASECLACRSRDVLLRPRPHSAARPLFRRCLLRSCPRRQKPPEQAPEREGPPSIGSR
eukprot:9241923-Alexandrium_andersonii.AAC.2